MTGGCRADAVTSGTGRHGRVENLSKPCQKASYAGFSSAAAPGQLVEAMRANAIAGGVGAAEVLKSS
jgi:hypothetical protein